MLQGSGDLTGKILGTCTLEKQIGRGGMGVVYLAHQARPSRSVAVKILLPRSDMSADLYQAFLARFRREADLIARLDHVNIMPIYEYGEQDGITYLVMPYAPGGSLRDVLAKRGALSLPEALNYLQQAASALDYAHSHGVIHRDIKPSNFLLHADGRLLLADFGIARMMKDDSHTISATLTSTGILLGTPEYMAPEMARGQPIDARADIYELGVVLFQMLHGRVPFKGETPLAVVVKQLEEPLPSLHQMNPAIPAAVDSVVQKATAKAREDRYRSAGELTQALRHAMSAPDTSSETQDWYAPTVRSPQPIRESPNVPPVQGTPPVGGGQAMNVVPQSPMTSSHGIMPGGGPITPGVSLSPITPYPAPGGAQQSSTGLRLWLVLITILLIIIVALGAIFVSFQLRGASTATSPTPPSAPHSPSGVAVTPTSLPPTPTPTPTPSAAQQARAVVQQYYNDINNHDYQGAYNLWGTSYQSTHSYNSFASGFANTVQDNVTFGTISPLSDGTVQVSITLQATDNTSSGTTTNTYQGSYIVGRENGSWKLLSANIRQMG